MKMKYTKQAFEIRNAEGDKIGNILKEEEIELPHDPEVEGLLIKIALEQAIKAQKEEQFRKDGLQFIRAICVIGIIISLIILIVIQFTTVKNWSIIFIGFIIYFLKQFLKAKY